VAFARMSIQKLSEESLARVGGEMDNLWLLYSWRIAKELGHIIVVPHPDFLWLCYYCQLQTTRRLVWPGQSVSYVEVCCGHCNTILDQQPDRMTRPDRIEAVMRARAKARRCPYDELKGRAQEASDERWPLFQTVIDELRPLLPVLPPTPEELREPAAVPAAVSMAEYVRALLERGEELLREFHPDEE
jgi:hypothetical protein